MMNKRKLVAAVRSALPQDHESKNTDLTTLGVKWFVGMRSGRGLQLSDKGNLAFMMADIEYCDRPIPQWGMYDVVFAMELQRRIPCPYYIHTGPQGEGVPSTPSIRLFDLGVVTWLDLQGGILEYLNSIKQAEAFK